MYRYSVVILICDSIEFPYYRFQVDFKEGSRKKNLLNKLKNMGGGGGGQGGGLISGGKNDYGSDMETNLLNEKVFHEL